MASFSAGADCQVLIAGTFGTVEIADVTSFESRQVTQRYVRDRLDNVQLACELPKGWEGGFDVERCDPTLDEFMASNESMFYLSGPVQTGNIYHYINERDGSSSVFFYSGVVFRLAGAGAWRAGSSVKQRLEFFAARRQVV